VRIGRHYGLTIATCVIADPESKGGSEATVRIAEADLVPTEANLLPAYHSFSELVAGCEAFCAEVNGRQHRTTRRIPGEMLAEERLHLHRLPERPYTAVFGVTRTVGANTPVIAFDAGEYSVPHRLRGEVVWVRHHGDEVVVIAVDRDGPAEVARHKVITEGTLFVNRARSTILGLLRPARPDCGRALSPRLGQGRRSRRREALTQPPREGACWPEVGSCQPLVRTNLL
jgi:hypothetical protein